MHAIILPKDAVISGPVRFEISQNDMFGFESVGFCLDCFLNIDAQHVTTGFVEWHGTFATHHLAHSVIPCIKSALAEFSLGIIERAWLSVCS